MTFNVGDVVTLKNGKKPLTIIEIINNNKVRMKYNHSLTEKIDYISNIVLHETAKNEKIQYSTKHPHHGDIVKCNCLGKTSLGQYILEVADTLEILFVDSENAEEIVNFTFSTTSLSTDYNRSRRTTSFVLGETEVVPGDVLLDNNGVIHRVIAVDTKDRNTKAKFKGVKLSSVKM